MPWAALLQAASVVQRLGMQWRLQGSCTHVEARVISFGNITAGGTGKTPAVIERAEAELAAGRKVAIITRGHGAMRVKEPLLREPNTPADPSRFGDEPAMMARRVPGAWIIRSADRVAGARAAIKKGCDTLLLDDGFQAVALARDENILVVDASNPFGNGHILPRGILREPLSAMVRATHIILTRCDQARDLDKTLKIIRKYCRDINVRMTRHAPVEFVRLCDRKRLPLDTLKNQEVGAVCGIGNPEVFFQALEKLGLRLSQRTALPDHAAISASLLQGPGTVVVTEKDAARFLTSAENILALAMRLEDWSGQEKGTEET
jgi:tetraacyldisaccharide 4'-kinase